jgi:hypothetical protein
MPATKKRPGIEDILRHEKPEEEEAFINFHDDDEEGFTPLRDTAVVPVGKPKREGKGKRSMEDMIASMPNSVAQSAYVLERIASFEDQIAKALTLCSAEARELVLKQRPSLKRYSPEE